MKSYLVFGPFVALCVVPDIMMRPADAGPYPVAGGVTPGSGQLASTAIYYTSPSIVEWASGATIVRGLRNIANPTEYAADPSNPLNYAYYGGSDGACAAASAASIAAGGGALTSTANTAPIGQPFVGGVSSYGAVALGQNGTATLTFSVPIANGPGADFVVCSNGFSSGAQEWVKPALVAVSSDGIHFFQFPSVSLTQTTTQVGSMGELDPTNLYDIAGKDPAGWGTPFDLSELAGVSPYLNVNDVTQVQIISVSGDINPAYATRDSQGNIINGPWSAPSLAGSEGFCLAGVGVINEAPTIAPVTWSGNTSGVWDATTANWQGSAKYQDGDPVTFDDSGNATSPIFIQSGGVNPASVSFNNSAANTYTFTNAGIDTSATAGISGNTSVTLNGNGTVIFDNANTYTGGTYVNAGLLKVTAANNGLLAGSNVTNNAGLEFDGAQTLGTISDSAGTGAAGTTTVGSGGSLTVNNIAQASLVNNGLTTITGNGNSTVGSLTGSGNLAVGQGSSTTLLKITGSGSASQGGLSIAASSALDIGNNTLLLNDTAVSEAAIQGYIANGANGGIVSSYVAAKLAAGSQYGIGYADASDTGNPAGLAAHTLEARPTLLGDANLDGTVNVGDLLTVLRNYNVATTLWDQGNFAGSGTVGVADLLDVLRNYNVTVSGGLIPDNGAIQDAGAVAMQPSNTVVPEPGTLSLLTLGAAGVMARRRRRNAGC